MEIHAPEGPTRSFREFSIHILIVTIGILIALGLEGIRETMHEHSALEATRQTLRWELEGDRDNLTQETANIQAKHAALKSVLQDYDQLVRTPDQLQKRVDALGYSFYYFLGTGWSTATANGVLSYMKSDEANRYAETYFCISTYQSLSHQTGLDGAAAKSFFDSRSTYSPQDAMEGKRRLLVFQYDLSDMIHLDQIFMTEINKALAPQ